MLEVIVEFMDVGSSLFRLAEVIFYLGRHCLKKLINICDTLCSFSSNDLKRPNFSFRLPPRMSH